MTVVKRKGQGIGVSILRVIRAREAKQKASVRLREFKARMRHSQLRLPL